MAYRPYENAFEDKKRDRSSVSSIRIVKVRSHCRKNYKSWRSMQASGARDSGCIDNDDSGSAGFRSEEAERNQDDLVPSTPDDLFDGTETESSTFSYAPSTRTQVGNTHSGTSAAKAFDSFGQAKNNNQSDVHYTTVGTHASLSENLPDSVRLSEQTGLFDGQVVFIRHPNRDVSAHQWSSSSFQWMNIGLYVSCRGQIGGSLASDRLRGADEPQDTLEYFKLAAANRQTIMVKYGRLKKRATMVERRPRVEVNVAVPTPCAVEDPPLNDLRLWLQAKTVSGDTLPSTTCNEFAKHALEDPFIVALREPTSQGLDISQVQGSSKGLTGSLDLTYRFPFNVGAAEKHRSSGSGTFDVRSTGTLALSYSSKPVLQDIAFGERTIQQESSSANNEKFQVLRVSTAHQRFEGRVQCRDNDAESQATLPLHSSVVSGVRTMDTTVRHPLSTLPITPSTYTTFALNAANAPHAKIMTSGARAGAPQSNPDAVNATPARLHYSDPDDVRRTRRHEVANGLNQEAPTPQTFRGPFFTDSKPTIHDPTVALSVHVSKEEKLENWFRDGHRATRQKEYAKSLIVAVADSDRTRHLGSNGKTSAQVEEGPFANTAPFVRLYENLSEYVEESRNGSGRSYFTRGWTPASPRFQAAGFDNSTTYASRRTTRTGRSRTASFRPVQSHMWC
ncbi:hypothetical protein SVAN01_11003 [Stagonosporopsis vannaccii]|nr:hypothetical protein SVAN01_11003 [Stagonosporopsis vannaccii]